MNAEARGGRTWRSTRRSSRFRIGRYALAFVNAPPGGENGGSRSLMTVLFTDIVASTEKAASLGDQRWRELLDAHDSAIREEIARTNGREIKTLGDGFVVAFASPGDGIQCALAAIERATSLGLAIRVGMHTGEIEVRDRDVGGIGVHIAARIAALAGPGEVLVSNTVKDLVTGSNLKFVAKGAHALKGVPGRRSLFAVDTAQGTEPVAPQNRTPQRRRTASTAKERAAPRSTVNVVLVDDHPLWRQTLRGLLEQGRVARVIGEAGDGEEAIEVAARLNPDVIVMDIDLPRVGGIEATAAIAARLPRSKVLVLSSARDDEQVLAAVRAGACGYLIKTAGPTEITDAIRRIHEGEVVFPAELSSLVLAQLRGGAERVADEHQPLFHDLTERERRVIALMADGLSNASIASALSVSAKTVESHVASIFTKLGLEATTDHHRRVLAVVAYLKSTGAGPGENP